jgi:hypothetical protein
MFLQVNAMISIGGGRGIRTHVTGIDTYETVFKSAADMPLSWAFAQSRSSSPRIPRGMAVEGRGRSPVGVAEVAAPVGRRGYADDRCCGREAGMRVVTAAELEEMTPAEREASSRDSILRDLGQVPEDRRDVIEAQRQRVLEREARTRKNAS